MCLARRSRLTFATPGLAPMPWSPQSCAAHWSDIDQRRHPLSETSTNRLVDGTRCLLDGTPCLCEELARFFDQPGTARLVLERGDVDSNIVNGAATCGIGEQGGDARVGDCVRVS